MAFLSTKQKFIKRFFDVTLALSILPILIIPIFFFWIIAGIATNQNGFFTQTRVGQFGKPFNIYKIRSLKDKYHKDIFEMQKNETYFGSWLRKTKLDEIPQIFNVLLGNMSFVGPRPDILGYADKLAEDDRVILSIKPGITGPATLKYKNEDLILKNQKYPKNYNDTVIWPDKVRLNKMYVKNYTFKKDLMYLYQSIFG